MTNLQERLNSFLLSQDLSAQAFERKCDIGMGTASRLSEKSYATTFKKISVAFPQLNMDWLRKGEGEMLNPTPQEHYEVGIGIGKQQGGKNDFKIEIKETDADLEKKVCDLEKEVAHLNERITDKDEAIASMKATIARLEKMNDYLMGQK